MSFKWKRILKFDRDRCRLAGEKAFWQAVQVKAGWISYLVCLAEVIIVCLSQKTKKVVHIVVFLGAGNASCEAGGRRIRRGASTQWRARSGGLSLVGAGGNRVVPRAGFARRLIRFVACSGGWKVKGLK